MEFKQQLDYKAEFRVGQESKKKKCRGIFLFLFSQNSTFQNVKRAKSKEWCQAKDICV
jgi:hypothetical protein